MRRLISRPFKGNVAYEIQIGSVVFQWLHGDGDFAQASLAAQRPIVRTSWTYWQLALGRVLVWHDSMWRHSYQRELRRRIRQVFAR